MASAVSLPVLGLPHRSCAHTLRCRVEAKLETAWGAPGLECPNGFEPILGESVFEHIQYILYIYIYI